MAKKIISILVIVCIALVLVAFNMNHYEFNEDAQAILSTASCTYEDTWAIVEEHWDDFDYYTFKSFMSARDNPPGSGNGFENYVRSLGGVFTKYVDKIGKPNFKVTTTGEFQEVALYTWGLMSIWGFNYDAGGYHFWWCNGENYPFYTYKDKNTVIDKNKENPSPIPTACPDMKYNINEICSGRAYPDLKHMSTHCDSGVNAFLRSAGVYNTMESCHLTIPKGQLRVGDLIHFHGHTIIVGEVNSIAGTVTFYDSGRRFIRWYKAWDNHFKFENRFNDGHPRILRNDYTKYGTDWWVAARVPNLKTTTTATLSGGSSSSISTTKTSTLKEKGYSETITLSGKTYKLYKQGGVSPWSGNGYNSLSQKIGRNTYAGTGCGPSAVAIALSGYNSNITPVTVGNLCLKNRIPSSMNSLSQSAIRLGFKSIVHPYSSNYTAVYNEIRNSLLRGRQIVIYVGKFAKKSDYEDFTKSGYHFMSILAIDSRNNKVFVGNSGRCNSGWFDLSSVVKAMGESNKEYGMPGWMEIYK